eukprot:scaffold4510_cov183-Amphora_coffeaeformis.AAC.63
MSFGQAESLRCHGFHSSYLRPQRSHARSPKMPSTTFESNYMACTHTRATQKLSNIKHDTIITPAPSKAACN